MVDLRIQNSTNKELKLDTLFERTNSSKSQFDYIIDRTFLRPRDVISFFNKLFESALPKSFVTLSTVRQAEVKYSIERLNAVEDEWSENYGEISKITSFLHGMHNGFNLYNIKDDLFAELLIEPDFINQFKGDLFDVCQKWKLAKSDNINFRVFLAELCEILYRVGILGIKRKSTTPVEFYYNELGPCNKNDFLGDCKIYVHKAFYSVLRINIKELEPE